MLARAVAARHSRRRRGCRRRRRCRAAACRCCPRRRRGVTVPLPSSTVTAPSLVSTSVPLPWHRRSSGRRRPDQSVSPPSTVALPLPPAAAPIVAPALRHPAGGGERAYPGRSPPMVTASAASTARPAPEIVTAPLPVSPAPRTRSPLGHGGAGGEIERSGAGIADGGACRRKVGAEIADGDRAVAARHGADAAPSPPMRCRH